MPQYPNHAGAYAYKTVMAFSGFASIKHGKSARRVTMCVSVCVCSGDAQSYCKRHFSINILDG